MLFTVSEFCSRVVGSKLDTLIAELAEQTGRRTREEMSAWRESLPRLAYALDQSSFAPVHLYLGDLGNLQLEYRLPASSSWCDAVLLGHDGSRPSAVILELKHWDTRQDRALVHPGLIQRAEGLWLHPAEQVKGYVEYCRSFHSAVQETGAAVNGCVLFTKNSLSSAYTSGVNASLTGEYPCFSLASGAETASAIAFLNLRLIKPDPIFAQKFDTGHYKQNRSFVRAVGETLRNSPHHRLELLDEQRKGLLLAYACVRDALAEMKPSQKKRVLIVEGPPGSGKSAIAARLWAEIARDVSLPLGDLVFVTTSTSQKHNLSHLFGTGRGAVKTANHFVPAATHEIPKLKKALHSDLKNLADWRQNLGALSALRTLKPEADAYLLSIVDEAHALVNPEHTDARGQHGFPVHFGPQAYHIIRSSTVSVFFLDEQQGFREQETTTKRDIELWAAELGAEIMPVVSLSDRQFRCSGSVEYVQWIDELLEGGAVEGLRDLSRFWRVPMKLSDDARTEAAAEAPEKIVPFPILRRQFGFDLVDSPAELDVLLSTHHREGHSVRLVASYARKWVTKKAPQPHTWNPSQYDFVLKWKNASGQHTWSRIWNWAEAPQGYVSWIDPSPGVPMAENPLCEVGCPYTVRGFDFDYLGISRGPSALCKKCRRFAGPHPSYED